MGQIISRTPQFHEFLVKLGLKDYDSEYGDHNDERDEMLLASVNDLLRRYQMDDLYNLIYNGNLQYANNFDDIYDEEEMLSGIQPNRMIMIQASCKGDNGIDNDTSIYEISPGIDIYRHDPDTREDAEIMLNGLLYLIAHTPTYTNFHSLRIETQYSHDAFGERVLPSFTNNDNFRTFIGRTRNDGSCIKLSGIQFNDAEQGAILASSALQPNVTLHLDNFEFVDNGLSFAHGLSNSNTGPMKLVIEPQSVTEESQLFFSNICNAISDGKNTTLKELHFTQYLDEPTLVSMIAMLRTNTGLITLSISYNHHYIALQEEFCQSLHNHPTLEYLHLNSLRSGTNVPEEEKKQLTKPFVELVQHNLILKEITFFDYQELNQFVEDMRHQSINLASQPRMWNIQFDIRLIQDEIEPILFIRKNLPRIQQINNNELDVETRFRLLGEFLIDVQFNLSLLWLAVRDNYQLLIEKIQKSDL